MATRLIGPFAAALAAVAALSGCVLHDGRQAVTIEPAGTLYASDAVVLRVSAPSKDVSLELDGHALPGTWPTGRDLRVPLEAAPGRHRLVARATSGALPSSAERDVEVDPAPFGIASVDPAPGTVTVGGAFNVRVTFTNRIEAGTTPTAAPLRGTLEAPSMIAVDGDRRGVTLTFSSLGDAGEIGVVLGVLPVGRQWGVSYQLGPWRAPAFTVAVTSPAPGTRAVGPLHFVASASGEVPAAAELVAGDRVLAALGPPPWDVAFDPMVLPDGVHRLAVRAPGYHVQGAFPDVVVDSTVPRVVSCVPESSAPDQARSGECLVVTFSEPVSGSFGDAAIVAGGVRRPTASSAAYSTLRLCPTQPLPPESLPVEETVALPPLVDASGNPLAPFTCSVTVRSWRATYGTGGIAAGLVAADVFQSPATCPYDGPYAPTLFAIPPPGAPGAGRVQAWAAPNGVWSLASVASAEAGSTASDLASGAWIERTGAGVGHVYFCDAPGVALNADTGEDARRPAAEPEWPSIAWSEADPAGGRRIRVKRFSYGLGWRDDLGSPARLADGSIADAPAVAADVRSDGYLRQLLAWIETAPGGVPQLRGAEAVFGWTILPQVANRDAAVGVVDVVLGEIASSTGALAWQEGDQIVAALRPRGGEFGAGQVLNVDAAHAARLPRLNLYADAPTVYWVERTASGDEVWARRWSGSGWELLPGPVNDGAEGSAIRELDVLGGTVVWTDDARVVRLRERGF
ncbi:Ig-like domain-containing protein [Anaeromyxobacter oryzae]|uniref:Ig-like domain-containing protein n=1 Tax=Anaeromyxobacter oryzae TaxID=2918170 RepID=UPI0020C01742|nr:Ig-like domain-containing protein [Anaeromyxobacter oryzae]